MKMVVINHGAEESPTVPPWEVGYGVPATSGNPYEGSSDCHVEEYFQVG